MGDNNRDPGALLRSTGGAVMNVRQIRGWMARFFGMMNRGRREREFAEELESHLTMHIEDNLRAGMSPEEARRVALIKLGGVTLMQECHREQRGLPMLDTLLQDLRFGLRMLLKHPGFSLIAILTLALGIGANTAIFSVVNGVLLRPLAYHEPERIVTLLQNGRGPLAPANFLDFRENSQSFAQMAAAEAWGGTLTGNDNPEEIFGLRMGEGLFELLGEPPLAGRTLQTEDYQPGKDHVLVLSYKLWQRAFGGDPKIIGRQLTLSGESYTVVGVMQ